MNYSESKLKLPSFWHLTKNSNPEVIHACWYDATRKVAAILAPISNVISEQGLQENSAIFVMPVTSNVVPKMLPV